MNKKTKMRLVQIDIKNTKIEEVYAKQRKALHEKWQKVNEELWDQLCLGIYLTNRLDWAIDTLRQVKESPELPIYKQNGSCERDSDHRTRIIKYAEEVIKEYPSLIKKEEVDFLRLEQEEKAAREAYKNFVPKPMRLVQIDTKKTVHQDDPCASAHGPDCNRC